MRPEMGHAGFSPPALGRGGLRFAAFKTLLFLMCFESVCVNIRYSLGFDYWLDFICTFLILFDHECQGNAYVVAESCIFLHTAVVDCCLTSDIKWRCYLTNIQIVATQHLTGTLDEKKKIKIIIFLVGQIFILLWKVLTLPPSLKKQVCTKKTWQESRHLLGCIQRYHYNTNYNRLVVRQMPAIKSWQFRNFIENLKF